MASKKDLDKAYDPAGPILHRDTHRRLDAIVRRFGGRPKAVDGKPHLPTPPKRHCKGQLALGEDGD